MSLITWLSSEPDGVEWLSDTAERGKADRSAKTRKSLLEIWREPSIYHESDAAVLDFF